MQAQEVDPSRRPVVEQALHYIKELKEKAEEA
jgi:hypothetical protein